jgi:hypothetical protein
MLRSFTQTFIASFGIGRMGADSHGKEMLGDSIMTETTNGGFPGCESWRSRHLRVFMVSLNFRQTRTFIRA